MRIPYPLPNMTPDLPLHSQTACQVSDLSVVHDLSIVMEASAGPLSADVASCETGGPGVVSDLLAFRCDAMDRAGRRARIALGSGYRG